MATTSPARPGQDVAAPSDVPGGARTGGPGARTRLAAGLAVVLAVFLQRPATRFDHDAGVYWRAATALVEGGDVARAGMLWMRGATTAVVYAPAALLAEVGGPHLGAVAVLAQNGLLLAVIGTLLLPRLVGVWRPVTASVVWTTAASCAVLLRGFAPFPLMDLWAAALLLGAVAVLVAPGRRSLVLAGVSVGLAVNLRPAMLLPAAGLLLVVVVAHRWRAGWLPAGIAVALLPQLVVKVVAGQTWVPWPAHTGALSELQARYASYVVRYDTVVAGRRGDPQLFFCSPPMARATGGTPPESSGELALFFVSHLPEASVLSVQKVAAALHWPLSTPYLTPAPGVNAVFALVVTAVAVVGVAALLRAAVRREPGSSSVAGLGLLVVELGCVASLATSATESRFAVPLVLVGVVGCATLVSSGGARAGRRFVVAGMLAVLVVHGVGATALRAPQAGIASATDCAAR